MHENRSPVGGWTPLLGRELGGTVLLRGPLGASDAARLAGTRFADEDADLALVTAGRFGRSEAADLLRRIRPDGLVAVVCATPASPVRVLDAVRRRGGGGGVPGGAAAVAAALAAAGAAVTGRFGLLRDGIDPVTAVDLGAPAAMRAVVAASAAHVGGARGLALRGLGRLADGPVPGLLVPAVLVVAGRLPLLPAADRITGMIGNRDSAELKLVRGEPPSVLEKHYADTRHADAEAGALTALAGTGIAPGLRDRSGPRVVRMDWLPGRPPDVQALTGSALARQVRDAADLLARAQAATAGPDGSVLVHGDMWLGNVLRDGDRAAGIVDWTEARRGHPDEDRTHLVQTLTHVGAAERRRLRALVDAVIAGR